MTIELTENQLLVICLAFVISVITTVALIVMNRSIHRVIKAALSVSDNSEAKVKETLTALERERALNRVLCNILFDLANNSHGSEIEWKLHIFRRVQDAMMAKPELRESEPGYDMIMTMLNIGGAKSFLEELRYLVRGYYIMNIEKGPKILDMIEELVHEEHVLRATEINLDDSTYDTNHKLRKAGINIFLTRGNARDYMEPGKPTEDVSKEEPMTLEKFIALAESMQSVVNDYTNDPDGWHDCIAQEMGEFSEVTEDETEQINE